jgi:hypothetical protein
MDLFTIDKINYKADRFLDSFESVVWTERYYGDDHAEIVLPKTKIFMDQIKEGNLIGCSASNVPMIIETIDIKDQIKLSAISLLSWMNNRFIRATNRPDDKSYTLPTGIYPSQAVYIVIHDAISPDSPYLNGDIDTGISSPGRFAMPQILLDPLDSAVAGGAVTEYTVQFGPLYDALRSLAVADQMGIQIVRTLDPTLSQPFRFRSYYGSDRTTTSYAPVVPVRFSPEFDSLTNVEELRSLAQFKNCAIAFATNVPEMHEGVDDIIFSISGLTGFDLRAKLVFADNLGDPYPDRTYPTISQLHDQLESIASNSLGDSPRIRAVSGDAVPTVDHQYGVDYYLGDIVEMQGYTGLINRARVTEYVRTQDASGEKSYPTLSADGTDVDIGV